jgi:DNA-binding Lrp family transcriptional regulator
MKQGLDALDLSIIQLLEENGRTSNRKVSRVLGVSEGTVRTRIKRLQADGLLRIIAVRNLSRGPFALAHLGILVEPGRLGAVAEEVAAMPEVVFTAIAVGHYDIVAMCLAPGRGALAEVVQDRIATIAGIRRVESTETLRSVKFVPNLRKIR